LTELEKEIIYTLKKYPQYSSRFIATLIGCHHSTVDSVKIKYINCVNKLQLLQDIIAPKLVNNIKFIGDGIITSDHHCPAVNLEMVDYVIEASKEFGIKRLFDIGDFFNFDALSMFAKKMGGDEALPSIKEELKIGYEVLKKYSEVFDEIYLLKGNHENRFEKAVNNSLSFSIIIDSLKLEKVKIIENYYIYLDKIRFTHPKSYSQIKMSVANRLTLKHMESVFVAHGHFGTWGFASNGLPTGDIPCMTDSERINYSSGSETTHPIWNQGFLIYFDGQIYPRAKGFGLK